VNHLGLIRDFDPSKALPGRKLDAFLKSSPRACHAAADIFSIAEAAQGRRFEIESTGFPSES
jgi:hypothetical protein